MDVNSMNYDVVGVRLPNGHVKVAKSNLEIIGIEGVVFENEQAFRDNFQRINEGVDRNVSVEIIDMILG